MSKILTRIFIHLLFVLAAFACSPTDTPPATTPSSNSGLVLSTKLITLNDDLTLSFPKVHPKKIAIKTPKGLWFVVHENEENITLVPHKTFMQSTSITKRVSQIEGVTWIDGKRSQRRVFNEAGEYMIYMANNLETEPENTFFFSNTLNYK